MRNQLYIFMGVTAAALATLFVLVFLLCKRRVR